MVASPSIIFLIITWDDIKNYDPFHISFSDETKKEEREKEILRNVLEDFFDKKNSKSNQSKDGKLDKWL